MLTLCCTSQWGLYSVPDTRYFCRSIQDLVLLLQSASPKPLRRCAVHSKDTEPSMRGSPGLLFHAALPGTKYPASPITLTTSLAGMGSSSLTSEALGTASHHSSSLHISLVFYLAGRSTIPTNLVSPCTHHLMWQQQPKQLPNPLTDTENSLRVPPISISGS